jgi:hypothetical protein
MLDFIEKNEQKMRSSIRHYFLTRSTEPSPTGTLPTFTETEIPQNTNYDDTGIFCETCDEDFEHSPIEHALIRHFPHWLPDKNPLSQTKTNIKT